MEHRPHDLQSLLVMAGDDPGGTQGLETPQSPVDSDDHGSTCLVAEGVWLDLVQGGIRKITISLN